MAGLAKGEDIGEVEAVGELVADALRIRRAEAHDWLSILVPLVGRLRQISAADGTRKSYNRRP